MKRIKPSLVKHRHKLTEQEIISALDQFTEAGNIANLLTTNTSWFENLPVVGTKVERSEISPTFPCFRGSKSALDRVIRDQVEFLRSE